MCCYLGVPRSDPWVVAECIVCHRVVQILHKEALKYLKATNDTPSQFEPRFISVQLKLNCMIFLVCYSICPVNLMSFEKFIFYIVLVS